MWLPVVDPGWEYALKGKSCDSGLRVKPVPLKIFVVRDQKRNNKEIALQAGSSECGRGYSGTSSNKGKIQENSSTSARI